MISWFLEPSSFIFYILKRDGVQRHEVAYGAVYNTCKCICLRWTHLQSFTQSHRPYRPNVVPAQIEDVKCVIYSYKWKSRLSGHSIVLISGEIQKANKYSIHTQCFSNVNSAAFFDVIMTQVQPHDTNITLINTERKNSDPRDTLCN